MSHHLKPQTPECHDGVVPKLIGSDVELANFFLDDPTPSRASAAESQSLAGEAARLVLSYVKGCPAGAATAGSLYTFRSAGGYYGRYDDEWPDTRTTCNEPSAYREHAQDRGRKFLPANGSSIYIDMDHLELAACETLSAFDHVATWHAMLRIARDAMRNANAQLPAGRKVKLLASNTDGRCSWGSHLSVLVTRRCYDTLFSRKMHYLQWLATVQCASVILTGAGKVGSENGHSYVPYNISARADYFETLLGPQTTIHRPICNSRDEALAEDTSLARVHIIFFDSTLCHTSILLRAGIMQIILAMIEQGHVPARFLDDPVSAVHFFSRDPQLSATAQMADGQRFSAVELMESIFEVAQRFVAEGRTEGLVPRASEIITVWGECLQDFRTRNMDSLATKIDWVAKRFLLTRAADRRGVAWNSPLIQYLDHLYASLDPCEGLYYALERAGAVQKIVSEGTIEMAANEPPEDTRAWLRAAILRRAAPGEIDHVNWDVLRLHTEHTTRHGRKDYSYLTLPMKHPLTFTRQHCEAILKSSTTLAEAVARLRSAQAGIAAATIEPSPPSLAPAIMPAEADLNVSPTSISQGE